MIETQTETGETLVTICNYSRYQLREDRGEDTERDGNEDTNGDTPEDSVEDTPEDKLQETQETQYTQEKKEARVPNVPVDPGIDANGRPTRKEVIEFPDWMLEDASLIEAFNEFLKFRASIRKPVKTAYAAARHIGTLTRLRDEGHEPVAVIQQSVEKGWQSFYGLKDHSPSGGTGGKKNYGMSLMEAGAEVIAKREGRTP